MVFTSLKDLIIYFRYFKYIEMESVSFNFDNLDAALIAFEAAFSIQT
jgi:hypothetical protein